MKIGDVYKVKEVQKADVGKQVDIKQTKENKPKENKEQLMADKLMKKSVEQANKNLKQYHRRIDRDVHEVTKAVMYKMIDTDTNEVIREFPPKKIQDMVAKMWELAGLFVDEEV